MIALVALLGCTAAPPASVTVLAASSLTEAFTDLEPVFEAEHPGVDVVLSFAGSQALATQVRGGIAAEVVASADAAHVAALAAEGLVVDDRAFATNRLVLALAAGAPDVDLAGLPEAGHVVLGAPEVPIGRYTEALLDAAEARYGADWRARVDAAVVSREPSVRLVVAKLALGEADAAVVYATDLAGVDGVRAVALPAELAPPATYHEARIVASSRPELATAWLDLVDGEAGRSALARRGFGP